MIATICITTALIIVSLFTVGYLVDLTLKAILIRLISIQEILKDTETSMALRRVRDDLNHCDPVPCSEQACKPVEPNQVEEKQLNQTNPKHEHTQEQLNILIKLAGKELTDEQVKIYFSKATNTLVYRYEDVCVKKEYHGKEFLNYTLLKHNRVIKVLYKEDLKEFDKVLFKKEVKEEKKKPTQESEYKEKVKDFMNLKRATMLPDENLIKKVGISREMLHRHISKEEMAELKELRKTCQSIGMDKIKQRGLRGNV